MSSLRKLTKLLIEYLRSRGTGRHLLACMADQEEDLSSLPLTDRFVHKVWKVRKQAYEDAAKAFESTPDESDPAFRPFLQEPSLWKGAVADSNVAAQQEGISALCAFLKYGGLQACNRTRSQTITPLVEKGLSSTRPAAKANALEALLLYIELDTAGPVIEDLLPPLSHKQPKIIAATLSALTSIYHVYGCKTVDPKPVLKALPKIFGHADKNVRAEGQNLAVELYRWLRDGMKPLFWGDLKPVQQQDLDALFEKAKQDPPPTQERLLKSQQAAAAASQGKVGDEVMDTGAGEEDEDAEGMDAFDLSEPIDVISKVPKDLQDNLASTKWKDRKDALDALYSAINVPRIKDAEFGEIVRSLAKCMKDANIAVVTVAASCVETLANGLRKNFAKYRSTIVAPMMERLKEKKQAVADALGGALDAVFASTGLSELLEDTLEFTKHKNPQVKIESVRFLIRCLRNTRQPPSKTEVKSISDAATKLLTESTEVLRSAAAETLGTVMKIMGERAMNPYLEGLDEIRKTKIKEYYETAEVKAKDKPKPVAAPAPKAAPPAGKKVMGKKPVTGLAGPKKTISTPAKSNPGESISTPLQPKASGRSIPSKVGGPPKSALSAPGGGVKLQKRLAGPGGAAPPHASTPNKRLSSYGAPPSTEDEPASTAPKTGPSGRGLAGRPLGKPSTAHHPSEPSAPSTSSSLNSVERAELDELRAEKERLQRMTEDLRSERSKQHSQINELQNQNAQLIEDHTRDVLSIKAKETQLVRARSDAEAAEQLCSRQQREIDRLKRELSRAVRAASPPPQDVAEQIYRDSSMNGSANGPPAGGSGYGRVASGNKRPSFVGSGSGGVSGGAEEKENNAGLEAMRGKLASPPLSAGVSSGGGSGGRGSPTATGGEGGRGGEGIESWKRAAEVTSQLKARIEQMKARQGMTRH
ncbi:MAG: Cytoskeleton associated protein 5 [Piccolia ochrophora]|nr:MAG: Cytoskeleton associated protein 5 [Piccolia ochrophora]